jgi:hypothetical protein
VPTHIITLPRERIERIERCVEGRLADAVENGVHAFAVGQFAHARGDVFASMNPV